jgi:SAM-dependent methyltransferase
MQAEARYTPDYFTTIGGRSRDSASVVAPLVMQLLQPQSVVDVGCGTGAWAAAFKAAGIPEVLGIDGDYCNRANLEIAEHEFRAADLTKPIELPRVYDLAICLEVAEHLDERCASQLIDSLTTVAPAVLFSAAIPHQGGEHHVNEQWPSYWTTLFADRGFASFDVFRQRLWTNKEVAWWYAQNMLLAVEAKRVDQFPRLKGFSIPDAESVPPLVHPGCWLHLAWRNRVLEAAIELMHATPPAARIVLADNDEFGKLPPIGRRLEPFTDCGGVFNGPPVDSAAAIEEFQRKLAAGATHIAFSWPTFWWLDHYTEFANYLRKELTQSLANERWIIFTR